MSFLVTQFPLLALDQKIRAFSLKLLLENLNINNLSTLIFHLQTTYPQKLCTYPQAHSTYCVKLFT